MTRRYTELTFTDDVKQAQEEHGFRSSAQRMEEVPVEDTRLDPPTADFIAQRDSFYMATVTQDGWPYMQHRGGPRGFLKVLDEGTLAFADYSGNRQLVSTGNLKGDDRAALFFMDYPNRRRLKLMAHVEVHRADERPDLVEQVEDPDYRARIERVFVLRVEAFDWNCPQHITPRYTVDELGMIEGTEQQS